MVENMAKIESTFLVNAGLSKVWEFHNDVSALGRIMPGTVTVVSADAPMRAGSRIQLRLGAGRLGIDWMLNVVRHEPMVRFVDQQVTGPFASWLHVHEFAAVAGGTQVTDTVTYTLPFGAIGRAVDKLIVQHVIRSSFGPRARATKRLLEGGASDQRPASG